MSEARPLDGLDLNLLVTLRALLRESSVTRAAERLGHTQPTVSRALAALRVAFGDPLLVRSGRSMSPTPLATSLKVPLERSLGALDRLRGVGEFDPGTATRSFRIILSDILGTAFCGPFIARLADAPGLGIQFWSSERNALPALLEDEVDLVVHGLPLEHGELYNRAVGPLVGWHVGYGPTHPAWKAGRMDREAWLASQHVQLTPQGRPQIGSHFDEALSAAGLKRDVRIQVSYVASLAPILASGPYVATLPDTVARHLASTYELRFEPHPFADLLPPFRTRLTWHDIHHRDPGHRWLREAVARAIDEALTPD